jgi:hypothetical protein
MSREFLRDLFERVAATYVQSFIGLLMVSGNLNIDAVEAALVAAIPAALSVVKGVLARRFGDPESAALKR